MFFSQDFRQPLPHSGEDQILWVRHGLHPRRVQVSWVWGPGFWAGQEQADRNRVSLNNIRLKCIAVIQDHSRSFNIYSPPRYPAEISNFKYKPGFPVRYIFISLIHEVKQNSCRAILCHHQLPLAMFRSVEYGGTASMATCWRWAWYKRANCHMPVWQVDGFGNILFCCHGLKFLKSEEIAAKYPNKFLQVYLLCLLDHYLPWDLIAAWWEEDLCVQHLVQPTRDLSARLPHRFLPDEQKLQGVSGPSPSNAHPCKISLYWNTFKGEGWFPRRRPAHVLQVCLPRCARLCWLRPHGGGEG